MFEMLKTPRTLAQYNSCPVFFFLVAILLLFSWRFPDHIRRLNPYFFSLLIPSPGPSARIGDGVSVLAAPRWVVCLRQRSLFVFTHGPRTVPDKCFDVSQFRSWPDGVRSEVEVCSNWLPLVGGCLRCVCHGEVKMMLECRLLWGCVIAVMFFFFFFRWLPCWWEWQGLDGG